MAQDELELMSLSTASDKDCVSHSGERKVSPAATVMEGTVGSKVDDSIMVAIQENGVHVVSEWVKSLPADQRSKCVSTATPAWTNRTLLHYAVIYNRPDIVKIFIEAGADLATKERDSGRTVLHHACMCSSDEDIEQLMRLMIVSREVAVSAQDDNGYTALHHAAENGHVVACQLLLEAEAELEIRNNNQDTPLHAAAFNGATRNVSEMIRRHPDGVSWVGHNNETPLHIACRQNHVDVALLLLDKEADVNVVADGGMTPLHCAASSSSRLVKIMLERGAEINPNTGARESPLAIACHRGLREAVPLLLDQGAEVDTKALENAVTEGYERIAMMLVKSSQWPKALRGTFLYEGKLTSPFRELIRHMPNVAEEVLNNCTNSDPDVSDPGDHDYSVLFNYEFVEDLQDPNNQQMEDESTDYVRSKKKRKSATSDVTYGCSFTEVQSAPRKNYSTTWGPTEFDRDNHPLAIMVESESLQLLSHPLVASLLHSKWKKFGQYGYFVNLLAYCIYLASLTTFALLVPSPQVEECVIVNCRMRGDFSGVCEKAINITSVTCGNTSRSLRIFLYFAAVIVILFAFCRLVLELAQIIVLRLNYIRDWINWMEVLLFIFSIIFVFVFRTDCACTLNWQWQIGALSVFLAWITLIVFISKFPLVGLYVLMFVKIFYTFLKVVILSILLVIAFALTFYMAFNDPINIQRSPWATPYRALLKTVSMTGGEYNFDPIFRQDPAGGNDGDPEVPFYPVSYLVWILFIVLMPILLANMLVGLAVGDIQTIQDEASLKKLALQVEQVLTVEELLPAKFRRRFRSGWKMVKPNRRITFLKKLEYIIWGGERYDTHKSISRALQSIEDSNDEVNKKTKDLIHEVERLKCAVNKSQEDISEVMFLVREIAKKHGIKRSSTESVV